MKKLGIVVSSTRPARIGPKVAQWATSVAQSQEWEVELIDLAQLALPFMDEVDRPASGNYANQHTMDWAARVAGVDALVIVTPQYNRSFPAPIKNAIDYLFAEWHGKPITLVGYGWGGAPDATQGLTQVLQHVKAKVVDSVNLVFNTDLAPEGAVAVTEEKSDRLRLALDTMSEQEQPVA